MLSWRLDHRLPLSFSIKEKKDVARENTLEKAIAELDGNLALNEEGSQLLKNKKDELNKLRKKKIEGIILRSKARWASQGEKINKYFCSVEKRHFISKQMIN